MTVPLFLLLFGGLAFVLGNWAFGAGVLFSAVVVFVGPRLR